MFFRELLPLSLTEPPEVLSMCKRAMFDTGFSRTTDYALINLLHPCFVRQDGRSCNSRVVARYLIDASKKGLVGARSVYLEGIDEDKITLIMAEIAGTYPAAKRNTPRTFGMKPGAVYVRKQCVIKYLEPLLYSDDYDGPSAEKGFRDVRQYCQLVLNGFVFDPERLV